MEFKCNFRIPRVEYAASVRPKAVPRTKAASFAQDVPSFLQEVTTARGQVVYSTPQLKAQYKIPPDIDPADDVAMARHDMILPLEAMAARNRGNASPDTEAALKICRCVVSSALLGKFACACTTLGC
jgi:hypothetical protein